MQKLSAVLVSVCLVGCIDEGEKLATTEEKIDVYASLREAKVTRLYVDDELQITVTDNGTDAPTYSPILLTLPGDLAFMVAICAQQMSEYDADLRYYTTGP